MSRDSSPDIPHRLRDRLGEEGEEERADLEATWRLLEEAAPPSDDGLDLNDEWDRLKRRRPEVAHGSDTVPSSLSRNGRAAGSVADRAPVRRARRPKRFGLRARMGRRGLWVGALVAALVIAVGVGWIWRQPVTVSAAPGQQQTTTLPDGSTVELNSGTTLAYQRGFQAWPFVDAEVRAVRLDGEAFFDVAAGARAFVVETDRAQVTVEGTRFNVRVRAEMDSTTEVTVAEGRVRVSLRARPDHDVLLDGRGQSTRVRNGQVAAPEITELDPILVWRNDGFAVTGEPLVQVIRELEQRYDTSIRLHESVRRTHASLSLYYPDRTALSTVLRDLCTALDLHYRPTSQGYEVFAGPTG